MSRFAGLAMAVLAGTLLRSATLALTLVLLWMSALRGRSTTPAAPSASFPSAGLAGRRVQSLIHASLVINSRRLRVPTSGPHLLACCSRQELRSRQLCGWSRSRNRVRYVRLAPGHVGAWNACTEVRRLEDIPMVPSFRPRRQAPNRPFLVGCTLFTNIGAKCHRLATPTLVQPGDQLPHHVQGFADILCIGRIGAEL